MYTLRIGIRLSPAQIVLFMYNALAMAGINVDMRKHVEQKCPGIHTFDALVHIA